MDSKSAPWKVPTKPIDPFAKNTWRYTYANYLTAEKIKKNKKNQTKKNTTNGKRKNRKTRKH